MIALQGRFRKGMAGKDKERRSGLAAGTGYAKNSGGKGDDRNEKEEIPRDFEEDPRKAARVLHAQEQGPQGTEEQAGGDPDQGFS